MVSEIGERNRYEPLTPQSSPKVVVEALAPHLENIKIELDQHMEEVREQAHWTSFLTTLESAISTGNQTQKAALLRQLKDSPLLQKRLERGATLWASGTQPSQTQSNFLQLQLYGHLHFDESIIIDGKMGPQTKLLLEIESLPLSADLGTISSHIANILQRYPPTPLRKMIIQKKVQQLRQNIRSAGEEKLSMWKNDDQLQKVIQKKGKNQKLTQKEVVMFQLAGNVFLDENILVDGIVGGQTADIQKALTGLGTTTARAKQWQQTYQALASSKQTFTSTMSVRSFMSSPETTLNQIKSEALITNPDVYKLVAEKEQHMISFDEEVKRRSEGLMDARRKIPELQPTTTIQQFLLAPTNEIDVEAVLHYLGQQNIPPQRQDEILHQLQVEMQSYVEQQKQQFFLEKNTPTLKALEQVFAYIQQYLDLTTDQQVNFLQAFNFDLHQGLKINDGTLQLSGALKDISNSKTATTFQTPINFSYDMATGDFSINTLLQSGKADKTSGTYHLNRTQANKVLFKLPLFTSLENSARLADAEILSSPSISPVDQETLAFYIEKNRTIETIFSLFDVPMSDQYTPITTPGMYHLCQLLDHSLTDAKTCALFREEMLRLHRLIAGAETFQSEISPQALDSAHREKEILSRQQDAYLAETAPLLNQLFNSSKREQDRQRTANDQENGLYLFLKRATPQISSLTATDSSEQQKIEVQEITTYLTAMETKQPYSGFITRA
ncbi:MAG: hypothetical protein LBG52_07705 [Candidatus Peribacteria bacterium]|jgi:hypothetical protein|nr:hypothetical protein [Candidatus Peribacteria bacterium]